MFEFGKLLLLFVVSGFWFHLHNKWSFHRGYNLMYLLYHFENRLELESFILFSVFLFYFNQAIVFVVQLNNNTSNKFGSNHDKCMKLTWEFRRIIFVQPYRIVTAVLYGSYMQCIFKIDFFCFIVLVYWKTISKFNNWGNVKLNAINGIVENIMHSRSHNYSNLPI